MGLDTMIEEPYQQDEETSVPFMMSCNMCGKQYLLTPGTSRVPEGWSMAEDIGDRPCDLVLCSQECVDEYPYKMKLYKPKEVVLVSIRGGERGPG